MGDYSIGLEVRSLNNLIRRYFDTFTHRREIEAMTGNNGWIIDFLSRSEGQDVFQKDIEEHFTIARSTASRVLGLMTRKGFVQKQAVAHDARLKKIVLTGKARAVASLMRRDAKQMEQILLRGFEADEVERLHGYFQRMKTNISAGGQAPNLQTRKTGETLQQ